MTDSTTLIVTAKDDTTADLVADALASRGGKAVLIGVGDFPINLSVTGTIGHDGVWRGEIVAAGNTLLDLESIGAVYYRRPTRFRLPGHLSPADRRFAEAEARAEAVRDYLIKKGVAPGTMHPRYLARADLPMVEIALCLFSFASTVASSPTVDQCLNGGPPATNSGGGTNQASASALPSASSTSGASGARAGAIATSNSGGRRMLAA